MTLIEAQIGKAAAPLSRACAGRAEAANFFAAQPSAPEAWAD